MVQGWKLHSIRMRKPWQQDPEAAHVVSTARKQRAGDAVAQFTLSLYTVCAPSPWDSAAHIQVQFSQGTELGLETPSPMCPLNLTVNISYLGDMVYNMGELQGILKVTDSVVHGWCTLGVLQRDRSLRRMEGCPEALKWQQPRLIHL